MTRTILTRLIALAAFIVLLGACAHVKDADLFSETNTSSNSDVETNSSSDLNTNSDSATSTDSGSNTNTDSTHTDSGTDTATDSLTPLPLSVDDYFVPSGAMGDGATQGSVVDEAACPVRAGEEQGICHKITYTPDSQRWAGVFWQHPANNWGTVPGLPVTAGAKNISFWAWADSGTEAVKFVAGIAYNAVTAPYGDTFATEQQVELTTTPTQFTLTMQGKMYEKVVGGFGWSMPCKGDSSPSVFYIDDIQWKN